MSRTKSWKSAVAYVILTLAGSGQAGLATATGAPNDEGLRQVASAFLDEVLVHPQFDPLRHRRVLLDPANVTLHDEWLRDMNERRATTRRIGADEARGVARDAAAALDAAVREAFLAQGYQLVNAAQAGVMRVSPAISGLYVNSLDAMFAGAARVYLHEAGSATLTMELRDVATGELRARLRHRDRATVVGGFAHASDVLTRHAFGGLYQRWSADCVRALSAGRAR